MSKERKLYVEAGKYLKGLRLDAGLTQRELNDRLGYSYYTVISSFESGKLKFPPSAIVPAAKAFGVDLFEFTKRLMYYNEPEIFNIYHTELDVQPKGTGNESRGTT